jgi:hypothetical protein
MEFNGLPILDHDNLGMMQTVSEISCLLHQEGTLPLEDVQVTFESVGFGALETELFSECVEGHAVFHVEITKKPY